MRERVTPGFEEISEFDSLAVNPPTGQRMSMRILGIKESDRMMDELRKENFDLKLRIYFLQDGWREKLDGMQTQIEEMEENIHDKETQILEKDDLLFAKETKINQLTSQLETARVRSKTLEQDMFDLRQQLSSITDLISPVQLNMCKQLEMKKNVAGISVLPHVGGDDDASPTETMGRGNNLHSKSFKAESHSKSNQDEQPFNEGVEYQTACSTPTSSHSLQLFLQNERSCLGGDSISLSQPKRGNSAPEIISSPSVFKDRSFQINSDLQQLLEVKTKENLLLRSKLGLLDHVGEIDPKFVPDVNQLKKEVGDLKTELNKASDTISMLKQQISMNMKGEVCNDKECKPELIMRMAMEIKKLRKKRLCGIFGGSGERMSNAPEKENFFNGHDNRKEVSLLKNQTVESYANNTTNYDQRVKCLSKKIINKDILIGQQSKELDWYKNAFETSKFPFQNSPPSVNFTSNIYCGQKFAFYTEPKINFQCDKAENSHQLKGQLVELKDQSELAIPKSNPQQQQQQQMSTSVNKNLSSSNLAGFSDGLSPVLAPQFIFSKITNKRKSPNNNLGNNLSSLNGNVSEVVTLLTQEVVMYASSFLSI